MVYGMEYLKRKLAAKETRVKLRYGYYDMKNHVKEVRGIIPDNFKWLSHSLGWCAKAVDSLADRIQDLDTTAVRSSTTRNIVAMTQAEYDALEHPDDNTLYILT